MADVPMHYERRPGVMRPMCEKKSVPWRYITSFRQAVTCPVCKREMAKQ